MDNFKTSSSKLKGTTRRIANAEPFEALGKLPPQAVDIEEVVLGALMLNNMLYPV